ncbi:MAG: DUF5723 family protein [Bacteroidota bacterium]|nr:DUF5723 family protein [Bacteroidota bacterium]
MNKVIRTSFVMILLGMVTTLCAGGERSSARLVGMGRTFTAISRGLDAVGLNPANLALDDRDATVTINLFPIGISAGSDFINYKIYNDYFTGVPDPNNPGKQIGRHLTEADKQEILGLFPGGIARTQAGVEVAPLGLSLQFNGFGLAVVPSVRVLSNLDLADAILKFPLQGNINDAGEGTFDFGGTSVNASAIAELNVSAGYLIPVKIPDVEEFSVGVGVKYLKGLAFSTTDHYNAVIQTVGQNYTNPKTGQTQFYADSIKGNFDFLQLVAYDSTGKEPAGSGMGFDIGVSALIVNSIRVGISITDIGKITWSKNPKAIVGRSNFAVEGLNKENLDTLSKAFKGQTFDTTAFDYGLPTAFHLGAEVHLDDLIESFPFPWVVATDIHIGFNNLAGNTKIVQYAIGTELDPLAGWLPLRTGIILGGRERFGWSAGFGIHFANRFDLDFATQSIAILVSPNSFRTGSLTVGMRMRF